MGWKPRINVSNESKDLMCWKPDLFKESLFIQKTSNIWLSLIYWVISIRRLPKDTKSDNQDFTTVSQNLIWLESYWFWLLKNNEQVLNISIKNKLKIVTREQISLCNIKFNICRLKWREKKKF